MLTIVYARGKKVDKDAICPINVISKKSTQLQHRLEKCSYNFKCCKCFFSGNKTFNQCSGANLKKPFFPFSSFFLAFLNKNCRKSIFGPPFGMGTKAGQNMQQKIFEISTN